MSETPGAPKTKGWREVPFFFPSLALLLPPLAQGQFFFANDLLGQFGAWWLYFKGSLAHGIFPLWNPYNFGGQPFAADPQSFAFYPFFYPFLLLPVGWGLTLFWGFHLYVAARGVGFWLDHLGASRAAQVLGGAIYALSGLFQVELIHPTITCALAWLPWVLASLEGVLRNPRPRGFLWIGVSCSLTALSGSPQMTLLTAYAATLYALFRFPRVWDALRSVHKTAATGLLLLGLAPMLLAAWPQAEFALRCSRSAENGTYADFNSRGSIDPSTLAYFIWPPRSTPPPLGDAVHSQNTHGDQPLQSLNGFVGPTAFLLSLTALCLGPIEVTFPIMALGLFGFLLALGRHTLFHPLACDFLPGFSTFQMPCRYAALLTLAVSILSALGLQHFRDHLPGSRIVRHPISWFLLLTGLVVTPLLVVDWHFYKTGPSGNFNYPRNMPSRTRMRIPPQPFRVVTGATVPYRVRSGHDEFFTPFPVNATAPAGIRNAVGYNPLILMSYERLQQTLPLVHFARLWSIGTVVTLHEFPGMDDFTVEHDDPFIFYRPKGGTSAVKFAENILSVPDNATAFSKLAEDAFDPERQAVLTLPPGAPIPPGGSSKGFRADFLGEDAVHSSYRLDAPREGVALFPDAAFPGWEARLDGRKTHILTAQSALRAVVIPPGSHQVDFVFLPAWWPWIPALMVLTWLLIGYKTIATNIGMPEKRPLPSSGHDLGSMP